MLRISMIGIAGVLLALQVKALKPEYGIYLCLAVSLLVFSELHINLELFFFKTAMAFF